MGDGGGDGGGGGGNGTDGGGSGGTAQAEVPLSGRDEIRIGVLAPAASQDPVGASIANGARLAAKRINNDGGIDGTTLNVIVKDTAGKPQTGQSKYGELIRENNVD
ncbi:MAG: ABC transporter substrate-binding protein, partial [Halobacteria archaeon]|nr:ABC transporter substrate-binding protein [Halobacteria archaeon]